MVIRNKLHISHPRTSQAIEKWRESMGDMSGVRNRLNEEQQILVLRLLAQFKTPKEVAVYLQKQYRITVNPSSLHYYLTHPEWSAIVEKYRTEYGQHIAKIAIFHKTKRLERLEDQYQEVEAEESKTRKLKREDRKEKREILEQARSECRPFEEVNVTNQQNILIQQFSAMDDQSLIKKKEELIAKITKIGGKNGKGGEAAQGDSPGGTREGKTDVRSARDFPSDSEWRPEGELSQGVSEQQGA